ncbi:virulence-associated protein E [Sphingomonas sp. Leaf339]|nr:virulence-associated protein E [Sphingomonas sp. Leaf339]
MAVASLKLRRAGREWKACCPFHADRSPSFTIYADDRRFMCFGCGAEGDVLDYVMRLHSVRLIDALEMLGSRQLPEILQGRVQLERQYDRSGEAAAIWSAAGPASGSMAAEYLRSRGITVDLPDSLRCAYLPLGRHLPMPALVAAVSTLYGEVAGIQRTFLSEKPIGKAPLPGGKVKFSLGRVLGGAIRLGLASRSTLVTEGLEDGLSLLQTLGRPVWVAAGAGMLPAMRLPDLVEAVIIGADNDDAGEAAAQKAAAAFTEQGKRVRIMRPRRGCKDFNDQLLERSS